MSTCGKLHLLQRRVFGREKQGFFSSSVTTWTRITPADAAVKPVYGDVQLPQVHRLSRRDHAKPVVEVPTLPLWDDLPRM